MQCLAFSPDDRLLVSVGREDDRAVIVWDVSGPAGGGEGAEEEARVVSVGRTKGQVLSAAWLPGRLLPQFATAGADGLLLWTLRADCLEMRPLGLPQTAGPAVWGRGGSATAVAAEGGGVVVVATASGAVYQLRVREQGGDEGDRQPPLQVSCWGRLGSLGHGWWFPHSHLQTGRWTHRCGNHP